MPLWVLWWNALQTVRPAFTRLRAFLWFATLVAGFAVRTEHLGVTSIVRALKLRPKCYDALLDNMHSSAVRLDELSALWTRAVLRLFPIRCVSTADAFWWETASRLPNAARRCPGSNCCISSPSA